MFGNLDISFFFGARASDMPTIIMYVNGTSHVLTSWIFEYHDTITFLRDLFGCYIVLGAIADVIKSFHIILDGYYKESRIYEEKEFNGIGEW